MAKKPTYDELEKRLRNLENNENRRKETEEELKHETAHMLNILGYQTKKVSSGEEAVEYLKDQPADLLLLDMIMDPGINGRETYERIMKIRPGQKAFIISGYAETEEVKKAQQLGAGQYIRKPFTLQQIGLAIKEELE